MFALLFNATAALADGMMLSAPYYYIEEYSQQAVIQYDDESATETISILPGFQSDVEEFAWILPVPGLPEVEEGDDVLFRQLRNFTRPKLHTRDSDWDGCQRATFSPGEALVDDGVNIIQNQLIGYYQTMTLSSDQAPALIDSLTQWGFLHDDNIDEATELLNSYVEQDWYFITVKIDSTSFAESNPYFEHYGYYYGQLEPLKLSFASDEIIYPMRISSLSAAESTQVDLYVISDHRTTFPGATAHYANGFDESEINQINSNLYGTIRNLLEPGDYLTHLRKDFRPQDMTEDITIVQAENDDEYRMITYSGMPWMTLLFLGPPILWGVYRRFSPAGQ